MSYSIIYWGFPGGSDNKEPAHNVRDWGSILGSGISHGEGNGYPYHILAWRISWTEQPGKPQSMGLYHLSPNMADVKAIIFFFFKILSLFTIFYYAPSLSSFLLGLSDNICIFCLCIFCCCLNKHAHFSRSNTYPTSSTSHFKKTTELTDFSFLCLIDEHIKM